VLKEYKQCTWYVIKNMSVTTPRPNEVNQPAEVVHTASQSEVEVEVKESSLKRLAGNRFLWGFVAGSVSTFLGYSLYSFYLQNVHNKQIECVF
jgi:hypothetical protein